jgi:hypothetical protein
MYLSHTNQNPVGLEAFVSILNIKFRRDPLNSFEAETFGFTRPLHHIHFFAILKNVQLNIINALSFLYVCV